MAHLESSPPDAPYSYSNERKPLMSITLPRNFAPMGLDGLGEPRTPDQTFAEPALPPAPHHSTLRIRRPRINMDDFQARNNALPATLFASEIPVPSSVQAARHTEPESELDPFVPELPPLSFAPDTPVPSIELPQPHTATRPALQYSFSEPPASQSLRLPAYRDNAPTTPPAQTTAPDAAHKASVWEMDRSSSVSSMRSNDSFSSIDTFTSRPTSFGGSATSPDVDLRDPFGHQKFNVIPDTPSRKTKKMRQQMLTTKEYVKWSIEMDNHLFNVYQMYLGDPTVTPFKTVPGSMPPSGVCRRVARRAKELWPKASKISRPIVKRYQLRNVFDERYTVRDKTPEPNDFLRVREATPTSSSNEPRAIWPTESSTRKRLRQLCKEKFTITAHYQRLRESRSPSPFTDSFARRPSSRITRSMARQMSAPEVPMSASSTATYATRELGISLVASGATAPLAQLVTGDSPPAPAQHSDDFFNTPIASSSQTQQSPTGLGIDSSSLAPPASSIPRLASPFNYSTWNGPTRSGRHHRREVSQNQFDTVHITGHRLLSPVRLEPDMSSNANKRRAQHQLEDELSPSGSALGQKKDMQELIFTGAGDLSQRRIRLRNRGATLGSTANNQTKLDSLFTPPPASSTVAGPSSDTPSVPPLPAGLAVPEASEREKRLGSPFELDPNKRSNRSRTPRHIPSMSDPFISSSMFHASPNMQTTAQTQSIGERLAQFTAMHQDLVQQQQQGQDRGQNPF